MSTKTQPGIDIEVTPDMIKAGVTALCYQSLEDPYPETVEMVFRAMWSARAKVYFKRPEGA